jgi:putative FmdB family regulatory protein
MPIYEYQCSDCGARVEVLQKVSDVPLATCGSCGGKLRRLISAPALQFRGSGWYITDYARKGNGSSKAESAADSPQKSPETASGAEKSSESGIQKETGAAASA